MCRRTERRRGVDHGDPQVDRAVNRPDGGCFVGLAVELRHPHAAEADGRHPELLLAEEPGLQRPAARLTNFSDAFGSNAMELSSSNSFTYWCTSCSGSMKKN